MRPATGLLAAAVTALGAAGCAGAPAHHTAGAARPAVPTTVPPTTLPSAALPATVGGVGPLVCLSATDCVAIASGTATTAMVGRSADGGASWTGYTLPGEPSPLSALACDPAGVCVAVGTDTGPESPDGSTQGPMGGEIATSSDGGRTWHASAAPGSVVGLFSVACATSLCIAVGGDELTDGAPGQAIASDDGGISWRPLTLPRGTGVLRVVACPSPSHCVAAGQYDVVTTSDGGTTWHRSMRPVPPEPNEVLDPVAISCPSPTTCTMATNDGAADSDAAGQIYVTQDAGLTWSPERTPAAPALTALSCPSLTTCVAVGGGTPARGCGPCTGFVMTTTDGGATWTVQVPPPAMSAGFSAVWCASTSACVADGSSLSPDGTSETPELARTDDGGVTWTTSAFPDGGAAAG